LNYENVFINIKYHFAKLFRQIRGRYTKIFIHIFRITNYSHAIKSIKIYKSYFAVILDIKNKQTAIFQFGKYFQPKTIYQN